MFYIKDKYSEKIKEEFKTYKEAKEKLKTYGTDYYIIKKENLNKSEKRILGKNY